MTPCARHPGREAVARCVVCGEVLCELCAAAWQQAWRCPEHHALAPPAPPAPTAEAGLPLILATVAAAVVGGVLVTGLVVSTVRAEALARRSTRALADLSHRLDDLFLDIARHPTATEGLHLLLVPDPDGDGAGPGDWRGPYLPVSNGPDAAGRVRYDRLERRFVDAWGGEVAYAVSADQRRVAVASAGPDRRWGSVATDPFGPDPTGDDIRVWVEGGPAGPPP